MKILLKLEPHHTIEAGQRFIVTHVENGIATLQLMKVKEPEAEEANAIGVSVTDTLGIKERLG